MPSLYDLVIDLINDAKNAKDSQTKLYLLEQIKEICFHRDKAILKDILGNIVDFMIEKSMPVRKFLIKFMEEAILQDMDNSFSYYLNLINYLIQESNDSLLIMLAKSFQNYYDSILLKIANMSPTSKSQGMLDPKQLWTIFNNIVLKFHDFISSSRNDQLKVYCLKIFEIEMVFGLPNPVPVTSDPRLARKVNDPRLARGTVGGTGVSKGVMDSNTGTSNKSADEISLHHPFISKTEIQRAAEENFTKVLLWSSKGGPQGYPFTPNLMSLLGQLIANVSSIRLKNAPTGAKALIFMIQGKGSMVAKMSGVDRENLARAVHRLLRATTASSSADPEGIVPKLKASVAVLENLGLDATAVLGQKRSLDSSGVSQQNDEEDNENILAERKNAAITAVNAAEMKLKSMQHIDTSGATILSEKTDVSIGKSSTIIGKSGIGKVIFMGDSLELSKELPSLETPLTHLVNTLKLVRTIQSHAVTSAITANKSDTNMTIIQKPISQPINNYSELALSTLKKLFENYQNILEQNNEKILKSFHLMCVKTLLSMILTDIFSVSNSSSTTLAPGNIPHCIEVQIVSVLPTTTSHVSKLVDEIPMNVKIPKTIWYFLGFILSCNQTTLDLSSGVNVSTSEQEQSKEITNKVDILIKFCNILYEEICWQKEFNNEQNNEDCSISIVNELIAIYDATCLITMTRMIQSIHLRFILREFMKKLPMIPKICVTTLLLLIHIGSKGSVSLPSTTTTTTATQRSIELAKNRGTRLEALLTMGQLVFYSADRNTATDALTHLLWCCIAEDFELRSKVINVLTNDILHVDTCSDDLVITFSLQAMANVIGKDAMTSWFEHQKVLVRHLNNEVDVYNDEELKQEDSMQIDTEPAICIEDQDSETHTYPTLYTAYSNYDEGVSFQGTFPSVPSTEREVHTKHAIQLLSQICLSDLRALSSFMDIYIASTYISTAIIHTSDTTTTTSELTTNNNDNLTVGNEMLSSNTVTIETKENELIADSVATVANNNTATITITSSASTWTMFDTLKLELRNILPVLCKHNKLETIFDSVTKNNLDPLGRSLLLFIMNHIYPDYNIPATSSMIVKVKNYIQQIESILKNESSSTINTSTTNIIVTNTTNTTNNDLQCISSLNISTMKENSLDIEEKSEIVIDNTSNDSENIVLTNIKDDMNFKLMLPLISGISTKEIEINLPRIILVSMGNNNDGMEDLKTIFSRITKAHPPPMSKAMLLVHLHKIDYELHGMKAKAVLDAISLCLNDKTEFTSEVIKEALRIMLLDKIPPYALMRTALLSSQSYTEIKKYVLSDVIPSLVCKYIWLTSPKLWDGVIYGAKNLATTGFKNSELTLRALLGLPYQPLKALLRVAPNVKIAMAKLLKTLSSLEQEEVCSGKWVGVHLHHVLTYNTTNTITTSSNNTNTTTATSNASSTVVEEKDTIVSKDLEQNIEKYEIEKQKIIKDIMNTPISST